MIGSTGYPSPVRIHTPRLAGLLAAVALAAAAGACGSSSKTPAAPTDQAVVDVGGCHITVGTKTSAEPTVSIDSGAACQNAPKLLSVADAVPGSGPAAKEGDSLVVKYYGEAWSTQSKFDSSWTDGAKNQEFTVAPLGTAQVIAGWNEGLIGAQAGSRRLLVIPPDQGYGSQGSGSAIGPNETLIFVVDVVSIGPYTPPPAPSPSPSASASS